MNSIQTMNLIVELVTLLETTKGVNKLYTKDDIIKAGAILASNKK